MRDPMTVAEAARLLEVTETRVRHLLRKFDAKPVGKGRHGAALYEYSLVDSIGRSLKLGYHGIRVREVIIHEILADEAVALEAVGLYVKRASNVLHATSLHQSEGMPIIVLPAGLPDMEMNLLHTIGERIYLVTVGDADSWSRRIGDVIAEHDLRSLVQTAWRLVGIRGEQAKINI